MNEFIQNYKEKFAHFWNQLEKKQKIMLIATVFFLITTLVLVTMFTTRIKYQLTYVNLDKKTAGTIVSKLEEMGIPYQLSAGGSNISVPESQSARVKVMLAQEDLGSGNIYSKFWENAKFGMTDQQFQVLNRGAIEEELRLLIVKGIEGITDANVMITLPEEKVFYSEVQQQATASVVLKIEPGVQLNPNQIKSIYNLISKSVPNLPVDNITLTNQYGDPLEYTNFNQGTVDTYNQQRLIEQEFQKDLKKQLDQMLTRIMGPGRVSVTVFAKMNFDQKRTMENIYQPVVDGKGIARSVETIQESFTGTDNLPGGITGTSDTQIPTYPSSSNGNGNYEHIEKRINYEVNEITKEVISSPYSLEDLSIVVAVDLPQDDEQTEKTIEAIRNLISPIVMAALSDQSSNNNLQLANIDQRIVVVAHEFEDKPSVFDNQNNGWDPLLLYGAIGLSVLAIGGIGFNVVRRGNKKRESEEEVIPTETEIPEIDLTPILTEEAALQQEIQKFSKQKPDEFVKLIRTWLSEE
ncbi:flagellar M-ring protein FliF [Vulcanibacillus modesticaldus]|uniref:Flagellar M-ring protein n=1 Tax=Vulcanibacillus modesticaldus TaxID=337097 RepID=A0A1D2YXG0_9BACI|nr:flagellar basal-body MS-ring/collar protein FliF [Vulcanibacillus modesticaldus]OEG00399.1 flagellar M-ring protein FliF [Vulcanibacillus modesticaldus]